MATMWARSRLTAKPPFLPAPRASSEVNSWAVPLAWAAFPPRLAISFCLAASATASFLILSDSALFRVLSVSELGILGRSTRTTQTRADRRTDSQTPQKPKRF